MANKEVVAKKEAYVEELSARISNAVTGVIVSYSGISVADDTQLRRKLRAAGVEYAVVKNTLLHRAAEKVGLAGLDDVLNGSTALATSATDYVAAAKILCEYADGDKSGSFKIKAGFMDGKAITDAEVQALGKIPPKEVLIAQVLGGLNAPITGLVMTLDAIAKKQSA